jgi:hypothetical protein
MLVISGPRSCLTSYTLCKPHVYSDIEPNLHTVSTSDLMHTLWARGNCLVPAGPVKHCPVCMEEPHLIRLACRRWKTIQLMQTSAALLLTSGLTRRTRSQMRQLTCVGSANVRFAIAVYYASDEDWDNHAKLCRTSQWNANIQADHSAQACRWRGATHLTQARVPAEVCMPSMRTFAHLRKRISSVYGMR